MKSHIKIAVSLVIVLCLFAGCQRTSQNAKTEDENVNASLELLIEKANSEGLPCSVAYLGNGRDIKAFLSSADAEKYLQEYDFIKEIPKGRFIELAGEEIYAIVPTDSTSSIKVSELSTDGMNNVVSESIFENGAPILIRCNISDIIPNSVIELSLVRGEKVFFSPSISLKDGSLWTGEEKTAYDFTIYE